MDTLLRYQKLQEYHHRIARQIYHKRGKLQVIAQEEYGQSNVRRVFWHGKTEYVANLPNTGLHSGRRLYFRGLTVGQVKKMVTGAKMVRRSAFGNVEVLHTNLYGRGNFRVLDQQLWKHLTDR
jgi:hypothetical protein